MLKDAERTAAASAGRLLALCMLLLLVWSGWGCSFLLPKSTGEKIGREEAIRREFGLEASGHFRWLDDPEVLDFVKGVGSRVASGVHASWYHYDFHVIRDPTLNAFAVPGGYVCVNAGLLARLETVDELAGVLAHEISHVEGNHYLRGQQKLSVINIATIAATILAAVAGGGSEVVSVGTLAQAAQSTAALHYSREFEREADQVGIRLASGAGFSPGGFVSLLQRLEQDARLNADDLPPYLYTHPMPRERVSDAESWIQAARLPRTDQARPLSVDLARVTARLLTEVPEQVLAELKAAAAGDPERARAWLLLGYAHLRRGETAPARECLERALRLDFSEPAGALYLAQAHLQLGDLEAARGFLAAVELRLPGDVRVEVMRAELEEKAGKPEESLRHYSRAVELHPESAFAHRSLGMALGRREDLAKAHLELASGEKCAGRYRQAVGHLRKALRTLDPKSPEAEAARKEIQALGGREDGPEAGPGSPGRKSLTAFRGD